MDKELTAFVDAWSLYLAAAGVRKSQQCPEWQDSIGILRIDNVKFLPTLPPWKQEAVDGMSMATYPKVFLRFNSTFRAECRYQLYADPSKRGHFPIWQLLERPRPCPPGRIRDRMSGYWLVGCGGRDGPEGFFGLDVAGVVFHLSRGFVSGVYTAFPGDRAV
ncbi:hypothetical protein JB92DRAFT_2837326 [Gautieria morchelliformis]|nr:hypothetical protein JB92DRAFT_2837326 [Gautieria morchelliformis]